jgi:hypothetical protein
MATTHDDNAKTWRELSGELTPQQIAGLESMERRFVHGKGDKERIVPISESLRRRRSHAARQATHPAPQRTAGCLRIATAGI